ncbi:MAG: hypothetical protein ACOX6D_01150 [Thermoguttaceae bacterium]
MNSYKSGSIFCERVKVEYAFITQEKDSSNLSVGAMCRLLGVGKSGDYH